MYRKPRLEYLSSRWIAFIIVVLSVQILIVSSFSRVVLTAFSHSINLLLLLLACCLATVNAVRSSKSIRLFWCFLAASYGVWALNALSLVYLVVILGKGNPGVLLTATPIFFHTLLMIGAVATRPHLTSPDRAQYLQTYNFFFFLFFGLFLF